MQDVAFIGSFNFKIENEIIVSGGLTPEAYVLLALISRGLFSSHAVLCILDLGHLKRLERSRSD